MQTTGTAGGYDYIAEKVGIMPRNRGNSNLWFLCGSVFDIEAAADDGQDAERGNPIVQS